MRYKSTDIVLYHQSFISVTILKFLEFSEYTSTVLRANYPKVMSTSDESIYSMNSMTEIGV